MNILVTGANGYLGQGIVRKLIDNGHSVAAADIGTENIDKRCSKILNCDIFSIDDPFEFFGKPDVVLHLAWRNGFVHNADSHIEDLSGHYRFLKKFAESDVKMISVMGSMHEIGFFEGSINENTPCRPMNNYGISKNALRGLTEILAVSNKKKFQWLRGYYIVGNSGFGNSIFSKITEAESQNKESFPFTTGKNQYDFLDYDDFCAQVAAAAGQMEVDGIINICSGYPVSLSARVERFIKENNYKIKLEYGAFPDRPYDSKAVWGDSSKIEKIIKKDQYRI